jgi:hypothetical protein
MKRRRAGLAVGVRKQYVGFAVEPRVDHLELVQQIGRHRIPSAVPHVLDDDVQDDLVAAQQMLGLLIEKGDELDPVVLLPGEDVGPVSPGSQGEEQRRQQYGADLQQPQHADHSADATFWRGAFHVPGLPVFDFRDGGSRHGRPLLHRHDISSACAMRCL